MNRTSGGAVGGGGRGSFIVPRINYPRPMSCNPLSDDPRARAEDGAKLLRAVVKYTARQLLVAVPPMRRTKAESRLLHDCSKDRRDASSVTLAALMAIQARADAAHAHCLSEQIRALELQGREPAFLCPLEASEREQAIDAELDRAQLAAARHKAPTYWQAVREKAIAHKAALRQLIDSTARYVAGSPTT